MPSSTRPNRPALIVQRSGSNGQVAPCPACGGAAFKSGIRKGDAEYHVCRACGLERRHPLPTFDELTVYYEAAYHSGMYVEFVEAEQLKRATAQWRLRALHGIAKSGRLLDVGCADGMFAEEAQRAGFAPVGIDLSETAVEKATKRGVRASVGTIESVSADEQFDLITMFDVLEHTLAPRETLSHAVRLLAPGGHIALSVPNLASFSHFVMGRWWYFYITDEHMHLFTPRSVSMILRSVGLEPVHQSSARKPMSIAYSMTQFEEYNPMLYRVLAPFSRMLPKVRDLIVPLPIGELLVVARKVASPPGATGE